MYALTTSNDQRRLEHIAENQIVTANPVNGLGYLGRSCSDRHRRSMNCFPWVVNLFCSPLRIPKVSSCVENLSKD